MMRLFKMLFLLSVFFMFIECASFSEKERETVTVEYLDGIFTGYLTDGLPDGYGEWERKNGDIYKGSFKNGKMSGSGTCYYSNGDVYEGEWLDGFHNGRGSMAYNDGRIYDGNWIKGIKEGIGYEKNDRFVYEGEFRQGVPEGYGTIYYLTGSLSGDKYEGFVSSGRKEGRGIYTQNDGILILGEWKDDKKNGKMTIYFTNGNRFVGDYRNDKANGYGTVTDEDGQVITKGLYHNDVLIKNEAQ